MLPLPRSQIVKSQATTSFKAPIAARAERSAVSSDEIQLWNMQWMSKTPQIDPYWCS
jgi:hypothetical protein